MPVLPEPGVVGALAVLQSTFPVMPMPAGVASLVEAGLERVPGVTGARLTLLAHPVERATDARPSGGLERFWLDTAETRYGTVELTLTSREAFEPYAAYVSNLANAIALHAEAIDQRARLEELLREKTRIANALAEADRRKDEFLGMLSHELRNPLAPIRSSLYILERSDGVDRRACRAREVVARQVHHLSRLVDDLLDVTRISRGKLEVQRTRLDLRDLVQRAGDDHRLLMQQRGLELSVHVPAHPVLIEGDPVRLAQVIGNLLHNAAKFTRSGGVVTLSLDESVNAAVLRVHDTGVGIDPDLLERIFEPFTQGPQNIARSEGGLGLGLALVKRLVELHEGTVSAASEGPGLGSELIVELPKLTPTRTSDPLVVRAESPGGGLHRHVLVVDDNRDAAESLASMVELFGHEAEVAYDGPAAIERVRAHTPDVVLCDIGLPGMDGYAVARSIRSLCDGRVKLVAVSGYAQPEDLARATESGFEAHLAKPAEPDSIERLLS